MAVFTVQQIDMQRHPGMLTECSEKFFAQGRVKCPDLLVGYRYGAVKERPVAEIGNDSNQCLVHRQQATPIPVDTRLVAKGSVEGLAEADTDIFYGMVVVNLDVAFGSNGQIEEPMDRKQRQHMIEKRHTGIDRRLSLAIKGQYQMDICFSGLSVNREGSCIVLFHYSTRGRSHHINQRHPERLAFDFAL